MTIVYINKKFPPPPFDEEVADMLFYRALYEGDHEEIFPRAKNIYDSEEIEQQMRSPGRVRRFKTKESKRKMMHHYVVVNFAAVVADLPARLINRALGNISADSEKDPELKIVTDAVTKSKVKDKIKAAVSQNQVDGRIAYRCRRNEKGEVWFEWHLGDMYFPHDDEMGADIVWIEDHSDDSKKDKYLRVERQRLEGDQLTIEQLVFSMDGENVKEEIDIKQYASDHEKEIPDNLDLNNVNELLCGMVTNDETLLKPNGRSALRNVDTLQEEINWTVTRDAIVFEKHGKPKLAIPRALWNSVADTNSKTYGGERFVRNADLEVVSYDDKTGAVPMYITWDAQTSQSFEHVKRLVKYMMTTSETSLQAVGLEDSGGNKSAIAILYEWIQSVIKAESIAEKFDRGLKDALRKCIILHNSMGQGELEAKEPVIEWNDMIPKAQAEIDEEENANYQAGTQSLETTIRNKHPDWSQKAIDDEKQKIEDEQAASVDTRFSQPPRVNLGAGG
jgi:hypothetical protein